MASGYYFAIGLVILFLSGFATLIMFFVLTPFWNAFGNIAILNFGNLGQLTQIIQQDNLIWFSGFTFMLTGLVMLTFILAFRDEPDEVRF